MFDRLTNTHHLNNLIWVWTTTNESKAKEWYPGDPYVDVVGMDIYPGEYQHGSQVISFNRVKEIFNGRKLITLSECGSIPYPELMESDGAFWSYFMPWYGDHTKLDKHNSMSDWNKILHSDFVVTLDEMPDLSANTSSCMVPAPSSENQVKIFKSAQWIRIQWSELAISRKDVRIYDVCGRLLFLLVKGKIAGLIFLWPG